MIPVENPARRAAKKARRSAVESRPITENVAFLANQETQSMFPHHQESCAHLLAAADAVHLLLSDEQTPKTLRRLLVKLAKKLERKLPPRAKREVEAARAQAVIRAAAYLRFGASDF